MQQNKKESGLKTALVENPTSVRGLVEWLGSEKNFHEIQANMITKVPKAWLMRQIGKALQGNDTLKDAAISNPKSLLSAVIEIASLGLDVGVPNEVHLVPFKGTVTVIKGYKGLAKLAMRSAELSNNPLKLLTAEAIYANDRYERTLGLEPKFIHEPAALGNKGDWIGCYALAVWKSGEFQYVEMGVPEIQKHKGDYVLAKNKGPYAGSKNDIHYGKKTCMRRLVNQHLSIGLSDMLSDFEESEPEEIDGQVVDAETGEIIS